MNNYQVELDLILLTRLTSTQNSFIILISNASFSPWSSPLKIFTFPTISKKSQTSTVSTHLAYVTILLLYKYHTAIIRWIPLQFFSVAMVHFSDQNGNSQNSRSIFKSLWHLCTSKRKFLISLNKLQML